MTDRPEPQKTARWPLPSSWETPGPQAFQGFPPAPRGKDPAREALPPAAAHSQSRSAPQIRGYRPRCLASTTDWPGSRMAAGWPPSVETPVRWAAPAPWGKAHAPDPARQAPHCGQHSQLRSTPPIRGNQPPCLASMTDRPGPRMAVRWPPRASVKGTGRRPRSGFLPEPAVKVRAVDPALKTPSCAALHSQLRSAPQIRGDQPPSVATPGRWALDGLPPALPGRAYAVNPTREALPAALHWQFGSAPPMGGGRPLGLASMTDRRRPRVAACRPPFLESPGGWALDGFPPAPRGEPRGAAWRSPSRFPPATARDRPPCSRSARDRPGPWMRAGWPLRSSVPPSHGVEKVPEAPSGAAPLPQFRSAPEDAGNPTACLAWIPGRPASAMTGWRPPPLSVGTLAVETRYRSVAGVRLRPPEPPGKAMVEHPRGWRSTGWPAGGRWSTAAPSPEARPKNRQGKRPVAEMRSRTGQVQIGGQTCPARFQRLTVPRRGKNSSRIRPPARSCRQAAVPPPCLSAGPRVV